LWVLSKYGTEKDKFPLRKQNLTLKLVNRYNTVVTGYKIEAKYIAALWVGLHNIKFFIYAKKSNLMNNYDKIYRQQLLAACIQAACIQRAITASLFSTFIIFTKIVAYSMAILSLWILVLVQLYLHFSSVNEYNN